MKKPIINIEKEISETIKLENKVFDTRFIKTVVDCDGIEEFNGCIFEGVELVNVNGLSLIDCILDHCLVVNADFSNSIFLRTEISGSKLMGVEDIESKLDNVLFSECLMDYCNFNNSKFVDSEFTDCKINQLFINEAVFKRLVFSGCSIRTLELFKSDLNTLDISGSEIEELLVDKDGLKGVVCNYDQAVGLARQLGIIIR